MSRFICGVSGMYIGNPLGYSVSWDNEVFVWMTWRSSCDVVTPLPAPVRRGVGLLGFVAEGW